MEGPCEQGDNRASMFSKSTEVGCWKRESTELMGTDIAAQAAADDGGLL